MDTVFELPPTPDCQACDSEIATPEMANSFSEEVHQETRVRAPAPNEDAYVAGAVVTERIFAWPGMGRLFIDHTAYA